MWWLKMCKIAALQEALITILHVIFVATSANRILPKIVYIEHIGSNIPANLMTSVRNW